MSLTIDLTPQEEAWLASQADQRGIPAEEIIKRMIDERLTTGADGDARPSISAKSAAAIEFLKRKLEEEATDDPEEIRIAEEELAEFKRNMNANRAATGERLVYP